MFYILRYKDGITVKLNTYIIGVDKITMRMTVTYIICMRKNIIKYTVRSKYTYKIVSCSAQYAMIYIAAFKTYCSLIVVSKSMIRNSFYREIKYNCGIL